jgi:hypothetical protein
VSVVRVRCAIPAAEHCVDPGAEQRSCLGNYWLHGGVFQGVAAGVCLEVAGCVWSVRRALLQVCVQRWRAVFGRFGGRCCRCVFRGGGLCLVFGVWCLVFGVCRCSR